MIKGIKMNAQKGFTLIELIMVIVLLGILAAIAIPRYVDLSSDAALAAAEGMAGALGSAMAINYAARQTPTTPITVVAACADASSLLQGGLPTGYVIGGTLPACTVTYTASNGTSGVANFTGIAVAAR